ncbi:unnamed protein product [Oikopleura dioica]|uniref:Uncharacterized protein n=2 Tax=Oikopleura dioica TaxID=34765 RepID=E4YNF2_OIKDI|nr:unnamed protein product [Oikopleura dioica]
MVDTPWFYVTVAFFVSFIVMWVFFGLIYWLVAYQHNDIEFYKNPANMSDHAVCMDNVFDFTTAFLFSLEGQTTVGYGSRGPTNQCWFVIVVQFIQWLMAYLFDSLVVTIIFTKLARPKYRAKSIEFSKNAVINERDGRLVLIVRIVNLRDSLMLGVNVSGKLLKTRRTPDGEWLALEERNVQFDNSNALFLTQPVDYIHTIDERSPLYELSESVLDCEEEPLELVVIMSGVIEGTGMACQVRTSYIANEILWGHRFKPSNIGSLIKIQILTFW